MTKTNSPLAKDQRSGCVLALVLAVGLIIGLVIGVLALSWPGSPFHRIGGHSDSTAAKDASAPKQLWTCGMHPQIIQDHPGLCPICHMDLTPMKSDTSTGDPTMAGFTIDPVVVQNMGVRTAVVAEQPLHRSIRAVGYLAEAEPNIHDVNLRVSGWIRKLHANTFGMQVNQGAPLFDLYSPELQLAIEELIAAHRAMSAMPADTDDLARRSAQSLVEAVRRKLEVLGVPREQIAPLAALERAPETLTFLSRTSGIVTEKNVVDGSEVKAGDTALQIVDYSTLWLEVKVFEKDLPLVQLDQRVSIDLPVPTEVDVKGRIIFISPMIDEMTRTATARVRVSNPEAALRPGMYATARIEVLISENTLVIPREALIDTGERQVAFVRRERGRFEPRDLRIGAAGDDGVIQVLDGLAAGEVVVTSGQFLLDSESRIREAIQKFLAPPKVDVASETSDESTASTKPEHIIPLHGEWLEKLDAVVKEYLAIAQVLGTPQTAETAIDPAALIAASHAVHKAWKGMGTEPIAALLASSANGLKDKLLDQQREQFKTVSKAMVELAGTHPPSATVADKLFVIHCPMAPGDWLQTSDGVANPYYATEMKQCGAVVWTISPQESGTEKDGHQ